VIGFWQSVFGRRLPAPIANPQWLNGVVDAKVSTTVWVGRWGGITLQVMYDARCMMGEHQVPHDTAGQFAEFLMEPSW